MAVKIPVTNKKESYVLLDDEVHKELQGDSKLQSIKFLSNLRMHSHGYAFFQRYLSAEARPKYETIYLHKYVAEKYLPKPTSDKKLFVRFIDGNPLNVQLENLEWVTMSVLRRNMKGSSPTTGYRGVTLDRGRFRVAIYEGGKKHDLGFFDDVVEAAKAYNKKSLELFGETASLNPINPE